MYTYISTELTFGERSSNISSNGEEDDDSGGIGVGIGEKAEGGEYTEEEEEEDDG
jgi:hypothetical protein